MPRKLLPSIEALCASQGWPLPVREFVFFPARRWRLDYAWPAQRLALEIEGGVWVRGRHVRPRGYRQDCEKYNRALLDGWCLLRVTPEMIQEGLLMDYLAEFFSAGSRARRLT
jgi:hypothetical protein